MITEQNREDFIERYLMGKLSLWELAEIEEQIRIDSSFAEEVAFERDLLIGIRESRRLELKEKLRQVGSEPKIFRLLFDRGTVIRYAIAACITILVTASLFYQDISNAMTPNSKRGHYSATLE